MVNPVRSDGNRDGNDDRRVDRSLGPRASMRARSYQASPGPAKASALCISLWMVHVNMLVSHYIAVDERGCGKVDNRWTGDLMQVVSPSPLSTGGVRYPQPFCGVCHYTVDLPFFRCSGCPAQVGR